VPDVNPQQQQQTVISANTRIYSAKRTRGIFQNRADTYRYYSHSSGSGATTTSITTTRHYRHHRFAIQSVQTASHRCAARSVAVLLHPPSSIAFAELELMTAMVI
jgi:hypothetical protein